MATIKQKQAFMKVLNGSTISKAMKEVGYSETTASTTGKLTRTDGWKQLLETYLPEESLARAHKELLNSTRIDHLVFPLKTEELTDDHITEMLDDVNCKVRKIVHSEHSRHVYFWSADNKARKDGLDMAYKLIGKYAPEKVVSLNMQIETDENLDEITNRLNDLYKGTSITSDGESSSVVGAETQN